MAELACPVCEGPVDDKMRTTAVDREAVEAMFVAEVLGKIAALRIVGNPTAWNSALDTVVHALTGIHAPWCGLPVDHHGQCYATGATA